MPHPVLEVHNNFQPRKIGHKIKTVTSENQNLNVLQLFFHHLARKFDPLVAGMQCYESLGPLSGQER